MILLTRDISVVARRTISLVRRGLRSEVRVRMIWRAYGTRHVNGTIPQHCRAGLTYSGPTALGNASSAIEGFAPSRGKGFKMKPAVTLSLIFAAIGVANVGLTAALWYGRLSSRTAVSGRQGLWLVSSLISATISSLSLLVFAGGWLYNVTHRYPTRLGTGLVLLGLLTAGYPFFCTMVGDERSRSERIRIFVNAVVAGTLWLLLIVISGIASAAI